MTSHSISVDAAVQYLESVARDKARLALLEEQVRALREENHKFGSLLNIIGAMANKTDVNGHRRPVPVALPVTQEVIVDMEDESSSSSVSNESRLKVRNTGFPCKKCAQVLRSPTLLKQHVCKAAASFKCDKCPRAFATSHSCHLHKRVHDENKNKCPQCENVFRFNKVLREHLARGKCADQIARKKK